MKRMRVSVTPPRAEMLPIHRAIRSSDAVGDAVLLSGGIDSSDPTELFSIDGDRQTVLSILESQSGIRAVDFLSEERGTTYVYVREESQERTIADAFTAETLVVTLPIQFRRDGSVELTVLGAGSDLQTAVDVVSGLADVTVLAIRDGWSGRGRDSLTDRQRTVLRVAYETGYYDYPRTATQEDVASELDITGSTVAEHLRNAEATLVERAINTDPSIDQ